jgi:heat-inducible transcriptional repressor
VTKRTAKDESQLDTRKAAILEAVVTEHIETAQPVGSASVLSTANLDVSSATIRSEMATLEESGYLHQPHTSAGRIPTDRGYRYFVDHLKAGRIGPAQQQTVSDFFSQLRGEFEDVLEQTSNFLSQITDYTSVVVGASHSRSHIISAQLVNLDARHHLLVTVFADGSVSKHTVVTDFEATYTEVAEASSQIHGLLISTTLDERVQVPSRSDQVAQLVRSSIATLHAQEPTTEGEQVFIGGSSKVAASFDGVETVRKVLTILEQEMLVVSLIQDVLESGLSVAIGSEHGFEPLASCAVVVAPVTVDGETRGAVGLLGPTRMKYREAISAAAAVSSELTRHLSGEA